MSLLAKSKAIVNTVKKGGEELYFGFGETSGPLNKKGRKIEMRNLDALGYDAKNAGPLYKHFPFCILHLNSYLSFFFFFL